MKPFRSIRVKLLAVVVWTTSCALLVSGGLIFVYDISTFRTQRISDMSTQLELLAFSTAPALQFKDTAVAQENLDLLQIRPTVGAAAIYDADGVLFASYVRAGETLPSPESVASEGMIIGNTSMEIFTPITLNNEVLGTAYMRSDYRLRERALGFIRIQSTVALGAMLLSILVSLWLHSIITRPVLSIARIAREVVTRKDFTRRAEKISDDEIGLLADAFNDMLHEIETRTEVLETTNNELEREIAERKRAREEVLWLNEQLQRRIQELREKDRNKDDFLATLAHELRNPLAPIRTGLEIIRQVDEVKREKIYSILERQTHQLIRLVDDLMDVSRISRGKVTLQKKVVTLEDTLQVAIEATSDLMQQKQHDLQVHLPAEPVLLHGDPVRLTQVFLNLLSNAAHYTNAGGSITLTARRFDESLEVCVQDNGVGMAPDMLEKVFEAFIQVENPLDRTRSGLGIGLTLARALIEKHDGTIRAESAGLGEGTRFIVTLPVVAADSLTTQPTQSGEPLTEEHKRRILVVDDNEDAALALAMLLRMAGHEVKVAYRGSTALEICGDFRPEIILMDLGMPGMNGLETAQQIRRQPWGKDIILVAVTGWGQNEDKRKTREAGFNHHLVKPVQASDIGTLLAMSELSFTVSS